MNSTLEILNELLKNPDLRRLEGRLFVGTPPSTSFELELKNGEKKALRGSIYPHDAIHLLNRKVVVFVPKGQIEAPRIYIFHDSWLKRVPKSLHPKTKKSSTTSKSPKNQTAKPNHENEASESRCGKFFDSWPAGTQIDFRELANGMSLEETMLNRLFEHLRISLDNHSMKISYQTFRRISAYANSRHLLKFLDKYQKSTTNWPSQIAPNTHIKIIYTPQGGKIR